MTEQTWSWKYQKDDPFEDGYFRLLSNIKPGQTYSGYTYTKKEAAEYAIDCLMDEIDFLEGIIAEKEPEIEVCYHPNGLFEAKERYECPDCGCGFWSFNGIYPVARVKE